MKVKTVGILSAGEMGSAIGKVLRNAGIDVVTCLEGRSDLTRLRAGEAGMRVVPSLDQLVRASDLIISVMVPSEALSVARPVSDSIRRTGARPVFADLNAISPQTILKIGKMMADAGVTVIDGGILGAPPRPGKADTRIYCSGPDTAALESLSAPGLDIRVLGPELGQASGLKMVYSASTKAVTALWTELLVAARALGLEEALKAEFQRGGAAVAEAFNRRVPSMPRKSRRWVGEMEEIAATFESLGMTPRMLLGAADMYRLVGDTPLADRTERQPDPSLDTVVETLVERLASKRPD